MASRQMMRVVWRRRTLSRSLVVVLAFVLATAALAAGTRAAELVMFVEAGCPWCARWDREVGEAYANSEEGRIAPLRRIDISASRRSGVRLAQSVTVTPTFVLVTGGAEVGRITGYPGAEFFWGMLGELMMRLPPQAPGRPVEQRLVPGRQTCLPYLTCGAAWRWV